MFIFLLKKWFFGFWDNLYRFFFLNVGLLLMVVLSMNLANLAAFLLGSQNTPLHTLILGGLTAIIVYIYLAAATKLVNDVAEYKKIGFKDFFKALKSTWLIGLLYSLLNVLLGFLVFYAFQFYTNPEAPISQPIRFGALAFMGCALIIWLVGGQYFFPVYHRITKKPKEIFKQMFIIFFDNPLYSFGIMGLTILLTALSAPTLNTMPGIIGIQLLLCDAVKLRYYKYDYMQKEGYKKNRQIPWEELLEEDRKLVGKRTFKNTIFPWKK